MTPDDRSSQDANDNASPAAFLDALPEDRPLSGEESPRAFAALSRALKVTRGAEDGWDVEPFLQEMQRRRREAVGKRPSWSLTALGRETLQLGTRTLSYATLRTAAGLLAVGAAAVAAMIMTQWAQKPTVAQPMVYATTAAQQATVTLRDGSVVRLGDATTLTVPATFNAHNRTVTLVGQGYFTVPNATRTPFIVRAKSSETRVLGTAFNVRAYRNESHVRVTVNVGKVSVRSGVISAVLTPRKLAIIDDSGHVHVSPGIPADDYSAWTTGRLVFRQTPVREIVAELGRAYGADVRIADSTLGRQALTWTVPTNRLTLAQALDGLIGALDAHMTRSGSVITLVAGPAATRKSLVPLRPHSLETQYGR